jgi:membrane protein implicated in regulation of membrane protease activity
MSGLIQQMLGLISHAFSSMIGLLGLAFVTFLRVSPLPDEVDFLLVCLFVIVVIYLIYRMIAGKR